MYFVSLLRSAHLLSCRFTEYDHDRWGQLVSQARMEALAAPEMEVNADKGFNFSSSDNNFIVQKKNHFQVVFKACKP